MENARHGLRHFAPLVSAPDWQDRQAQIQMRLHLLAGQPQEALGRYVALDAELRKDWKRSPTEAAQKIRDEARSSVMTLNPNPPRLYGRQAELAQLRQRLAAMPPLVTLTGPPGAGKTRLAKAAADVLRDTFGSAVCFVPLHTVSDGSGIPEAILSAWAGPRPGGTVQDAAVAVLSSAPCLLVLDNFEHLLAPGRGGAETLTTLLDRVPTLTCLITSRERLRAHLDTEWEEQELHVPPLALPRPGASLAELRRCPSVQMFTFRAGSAGGFVLTEQNAGSVAALCRLTEGLPLSIVLVAEWARTHTPARMIRELHELLKQERQVPHIRHRSLEVALRRSYDLLESETAYLFARLAVFRGGWTLDAAEAVCQVSDETGPDIAIGLGWLLDRSLVEGIEAGAERRFFLLDTLRAFAAEQMTPEEQHSLSRSHAAYYAALAAQSQELFSQDQATWRALLDADYANMQAALEWSAQAPDGVGIGLEMAAALRRYWDVRGWFDEGIGYTALLLARSEGEAPAVRAEAHNALGRLFIRKGDGEQTRAHFQRALDLAAPIEYLPAMATAYNGLGAVRMLFDKQYPEARADFERSQELFGRIGNVVDRIAPLGNAALLFHEQGEYAQARERLEECLRLQEPLGDLQSLSATRMHLGQAHLNLGNYAEATRYLRASTRADWRQGNRRRMGIALNAQGDVARHTGRLAWAQLYYAASLRLLWEQGDRRALMYALECWADLRLRQNRLGEAAQALGAAAAERERGGFSFSASARPQHERTVAALQDALGSSEYERNRQEGYGRPLETTLRPFLKTDRPASARQARHTGRA